jgi:hypothetical protein
VYGLRDLGVYRGLPPEVVDETPEESAEIAEALSAAMEDSSPLQPLLGQEEPEGGRHRPPRSPAGPREIHKGTLEQNRRPTRR